MPGARGLEVASGEDFEPGGYFGRDGSLVADPARDGCLVFAEAAGEVADGPVDDGQIGEQPSAEHLPGWRRRSLRRLRALDEKPVVCSF